MDKSKFSRDISLIVIGATVSCLSSIITSTLSNNHDTNKEEVTRKISLLNQVTGNYGDRMYVTVKWIKAKQQHNASDDSLYKKKYYVLKEEWNKDNYSYTPLIIHYFGQSDGNEYTDSIRNPMVSIGQAIERNQCDSTQYKIYRSKLDSLTHRAERFFERLYDKCD